MSARVITGATRVAGVVGAPVAHSLSPVIHNAWLAAADIDGVYVPFSPEPRRLENFIEGCRGGALAGLNVTLPFKERALAIADWADAAAKAAGAANLLVFHPDGTVEARNTDGLGLISAFAEQAPKWKAVSRPVVVLGAGGAARGAVAALARAGAEVRVVNRTIERAQSLAADFIGVTASGWDRIDAAFIGVSALINAASAGLGSSDERRLPLHLLPSDAVVMDMVYAPLHTALLVAAQARGLEIVDGLAMLIGQARPSFEAFFGVPPLELIDIRHVALQALRDQM